MPWKIVYHESDAIVETTYAGVLTVDALREAVRRTLEVSVERGTSRFLADCSRLEGGHSVLDLFDLAEELSGGNADRKLKEAVILPRKAGPAANADFWETACRNRGFNVRLFQAREVAIEWLAGRG
jgi:hypothetical protein